MNVPPEHHLSEQPQPLDLPSVSRRLHGVRATGLLIVAGVVAESIIVAIGGFALSKARSAAAKKTEPAVVAEAEIKPATTNAQAATVQAATKASSPRPTTRKHGPKSGGTDDSTPSDKQSLDKAAGTLRFTLVYADRF